MKTLYLLLFVASIALTGCAGTGASSYPEAARESAYLVNDALHAGRYDIATKASDQEIRIVPAPQVRLKVHAAMALRSPDAGIAPVPTQVAVLPQGTGPTVTVGTPDFSTMNLSLGTDPVPTLEKHVDKTTQATDQKLVNQSTEINKLNTENAGLKPYRNIIIAGIILLVLGGAGVLFIYLCKVGIITGKLAATVAAKFP